MIDSAVCRMAVLLLGLLSTATGAQEPARTLHGVGLPQFAHSAALDAHLRLAGATVVDRSYMPFQVVALYVGRDAINVETLADGLSRCRIEIHWLGPPLDAAAAADWWHAEFERALPDPAARARLGDALTRIASKAGAVQRDSVTAIDYDPDAGLFVSRDGVVAGRFAGLQLSRAVLGIWLGASAEEIRDVLTRDRPPSPPTP